MSSPSLHIVNKSSLNSNALASCLAVATPGDYLLLIEDGVYSVLDPSWLQAPVQIHVLVEDLHARGLGLRAERPDAEGTDAANLDARINRVDYPGFVALVCRCARTVSWS